MLQRITDAGSFWMEYALSHTHYNDVIIGAMASQIASLMIVYSTVYSDADQRKHQSSVSLAFVRAIHRWSVNSPHKWPVTRKKFPFDDVGWTRNNQHAAAIWSAAGMWQRKMKYSVSQEICTRFCCALLCCGYAIVHNELTWSIYPYSSGLLCWHWGNR